MSLCIMTVPNILTQYQQRISVTDCWLATSETAHWLLSWISWGAAMVMGDRAYVLCPDLQFTNSSGSIYNVLRDNPRPPTKLDITIQNEYSQKSTDQSHAVIC